MDMLSSMAAPALLLRILLWLAAVLTAQGRLALPTINLTIPVNPVREGSVLSIHCKIYNLNDNNIVAMTRKLKDGTMLRLFLARYGVEISHPNERIFTAVRQFADGSIVYFVTIIHASRSDEGTYFCSVMSDYTVIAEESALVDVEYFPSDGYPWCNTSHHDYRIHEGTKVNLTCTTERGNPPVSIIWKRVGKSSLLRATDIVTGHTGEHDLVTSTLTMRPTIEDDGGIFLCSIRSPVFDGQTGSCHLGPFAVTYLQPRTNDVTYKTSPNPNISHSSQSNSTNNLHNNGLHNDIRFHTWAIVIAATICIIVLTIGMTFIIVFYGLGYSKRSRVVDHSLPHIRHQRGDVRVEYRRSAEPNIYVAV